MPAAEPSRPRSTYVISLTAFADDGSLDETGYRQHLRRMADAGIGVYVGGGGSGEGYALSSEETRRVYEIAAEELKGKVPVRGMGVEPRSAPELIRLAGLARDAGLEAMQVYSVDIGHGIRPTDAELERYFSEVIAAVELPVVVSTHFSVGYVVPVDLLQRLIDRHDHIIGINCTTPATPYVVSVIERFAGQVEVHVGAPEQAQLALTLGATGYLNSEGNLVPRLCASVIDHFEAGEWAEFHTAAATLARLHCLGSRFWGLGGITGMKTALRRFGLPGGPPRPPRLPLDDDTEEALAALLDELGIAAIEGLEGAGRQGSRAPGETR